MADKTPEEIRQTAHRIRESAQRASGVNHYTEMQQADALFRKADRLEEENKKAEESKVRQQNFRKKDLQKIHLLAKQAGLEGDTYRDMLENQTGQRSAGKMTREQRYKVIIYLKKTIGTTSSTPYPGRPQNADNHPQLLKTEALLSEAKRPWNYAGAMAKKMYQKDKLEFCNTAELSGIIAALTRDAKRHGRRTA